MRILNTIPILLTAAPSMFGTALAGPLDIHRDDAVHIVFPADLRADVNRPGDGFYAAVDHDPLLPEGTRLYGHVDSVHWATYRRPASMSLVFDTLATPKGHRIRILAIPTKLDDPHLRRGTNGRLVSGYRPGDAAGYTVAGAATGLIVGGILHRPILGGVLGAFVGSIAGHERAREEQNLIVAKGEHMAAVFVRDVAETEREPVGVQGGWRSGELGPHQPPAQLGIRAPLQITVGEHALNFDPTKLPYRDGDVVMVPVENAAEQLQVDVTRHADGRITLEGPNGAIELHPDSTSFRTDSGQSGDLRHPVVNRDGVAFVPIEAFAAVSQDRISVNGNAVQWKA